MKIGFDAKRYYHNSTGLGNYSRTIIGGLKRMFPENEYVLYDEKSFTRTFKLGKKAALDGCDIFHGLSNEIPFDMGDGCLAGDSGLVLGDSGLVLGDSGLVLGDSGLQEGNHQHLTPNAQHPTNAQHPKFIVTIHDVAWRTFPNMYHWIDRQIYDYKYGRSCRKADMVIAISESTMRDVIRFYGVPEENIRVIYQPVQKHYYTPLPDDTCEELIKEHFSKDGLPPYILYVGSINSRKNLLSALKALTLIPKENRPLLLIVGNGREYRKECEEYISKNDLKAYTRIDTEVKDDKLLQALYAKALTFIYPSFYEGFGLPVVEAALQKTPVITTTVSSLPEAAGPDACLIDPHAKDAEEQIAHHIERLTSDEAYRKEIGEKMESYARRMFTPDVLTKQMMELYKEMIER